MDQKEVDYRAQQLATWIEEPMNRRILRLLMGSLIPGDVTDTEALQIIKKALERVKL